jgi:hypothetical protein
MKNAVTPAEHQFSLWCNVLSIKLPTCFSNLLLHVTASDNFLHRPQKVTQVVPIQLAHVAIAVAL